MPGSYAVSSIDRASRWCGALEQCGTKRIFFIIGDGFILQWSRCEKTGMWYVAFRCRCAERWVGARVLCAAKDAERSFLFDRTQSFYRAPTERIAQQQRKKKHNEATLPQCIFAHLSKRRTAKNALRTALFQSTAQAQARSAAHYVSSLHEFARTKHFPPSQREARSGERTA